MLQLTDRFLPLGWLLLYLLLPTSGPGASGLKGWFDQNRDLEALRSVLSTGHATAIDGNKIGPAYIAAAALVHLLGRLSPEDALIDLTRISYALSVAGGMVLVRLLVRRLAPAPAATSLAAQLTFVALAVAAWTWRWSDFPWSHFLAMGLAVALYLVRFAPRRVSTVSASVTGGLLAALALTRTFEFGAVALAWGIALAVLGLLRIWDRPRLRMAHLLGGAGGFIAVGAAVQIATGKHGLFFLYGSDLGRQSGQLAPGEIAASPTFSIGLLPVKIVQLFVDPCYYSSCAANDYQLSPIRVDGHAGLWRMPLAIQMPSLVLLPLCVLAIAAVLVWAARHREIALPRSRELRLLLEMTLVATGVTFGYLANTLTGSAHLKYGFAREFLLPSMLTGVVAISLAFTGLWLVLARWARRPLAQRRLRMSPQGALIVLTVMGVAGLTLGMQAARSHGLPRIESKHLGRIEYVADCTGSTCGIRIETATTSGAPISIPKASTLTFACSGGQRLTLFVRKPTAGVQIESGCRAPRLVAAWPIVMGLPPDDRHLRMVRVENSDGAQ